MPYVALDLETTGLDPENDEIIEVAAIRFDATGVLDTYHTLVNPRRRLEYRIELLTGIEPDALAAAPSFGSVALEVEEFLGLDPIIGQNPNFDTAFLRRKGVQVFGPTFDTFELAGLLLPDLQQHSLGAICDHLGIDFPTRHRALADAEAAMFVFQALRARLLECDTALLAEAERIASVSDWPLRHLLREVAAERPHRPGDDEREGFVHRFVKAPSPPVEPPAPSTHIVPTPPEEPVRLLASGTARDAISGFEERPEQAAMARAVTQTLIDGDRLVVEAGTGVGKSLAYLVPAALHAARNNTRAVISTNTINLQEQLIGQDIPVTRQLVEAAGIARERLRIAQMKGRRNYLCLLRWATLARSQSLSAEDASLLVRLLFWLGRTDTGDRAELRLRREEDSSWSRVSAQEGNCIAMQCSYVRDGSCFLHRARNRAATSHLLVVNHALLLSDVQAGGNVLPDYQHLIVDEAHHLEEEATRQFGFVASEADVLAWLDRLYTRAGRDRDGGLAATLRVAARAASQQAIGPAPQLESMAQTLTVTATRARDRVPAFFRLLADFGRERASGRNDYDERVVINRTTRVQPDWTDIEASWFETEELLAAANGVVDEVHAMLMEMAPADLLDRDAAIAEAAELHETGEQLRNGISRIIGHDDREMVCWLTMPRREASPSLASAPLSVSETLRARLFDTKESVVLTSATLSTDGHFEYVKGRLGCEDARELLLGSPFDHRQSTLLLTPSDMPEPDQHGYLSALQTAVIDLTTASEGRALVLFTSHAALRAAYQGVKQQLEEREILVLGQGIDGTPRQLLSALRENHRTVVFGAASFWEGVDITGEALSLLIMARLPFSVPTDPVFQARAELFDAPFEQYALPQAILRFKQGFGRLIRRKTDRGVMVVLDRRLRSKRYGEMFLRSLPPCDLREAPLRDLPGDVAAWLAAPGTGVLP